MFVLFSLLYSSVCILLCLCLWFCVFVSFELFDFTFRFFCLTSCSLIFCFLCFFGFFCVCVCVCVFVWLVLLLPSVCLFFLLLLLLFVCFCLCYMSWGLFFCLFHLSSSPITFFSFFFSPLLPWCVACGGGFVTPAKGWAWASGVGAPSTGCWTAREFLAPGNINP